MEDNCAQSVLNLIKIVLPDSLLQRTAMITLSLIDVHSKNDFHLDLETIRRSIFVIILRSLVKKVR